MMFAALIIVGIVAVYLACARPNWFWIVFACAPILLRVLAAAGNLNPNSIEAGPVRLRVWDPCVLGLAFGILYHCRTQGLRSLRQQPGILMLVGISLFLAIKVLFTVLFGGAALSVNGIANPFLGGTVAAVGEIRDSFIGLIAPIYAILAARHLKMFRMMLPLVIAVSVILLLAAIQVGVAGQIWSNNAQFRFLAADETATLTVLSFVLLFLRPSRPSRIPSRFLALVALGVAVLANHRCVWLGMLLSGAVLLVLVAFGKLQLSRDRSVRALYMAAITLVVALGVTVVCSGAFGIQSLSDSNRIGQRLLAITDPGQDPTASWRQELWRQRIEQVGDDWLWGRQLGDRRLSLVGANWVAFPDHNAYVTAFELGGVLLLGLVVAYWGALAAKAVKVVRMSNLPAFSWQPALALAVIAMSLGYSVAYDFPSIGAALATILVLHGSGLPLSRNIRLSYVMRPGVIQPVKVAAQIRTPNRTVEL